MSIIIHHIFFSQKITFFAETIVYASDQNEIPVFSLLYQRKGE